jgi:hypothetical protein
VPQTISSDTNPAAVLEFWMAPEKVLASPLLPTASVPPPTESSTVPPPHRPLMLVKLPARSRTPDPEGGPETVMSPAPGLAEVFATLTNAALSLLRLIQPPTKPLRAIAELVQWRPQTVLNQLGFRGTH